MSTRMSLADYRAATQKPAKKPAKQPATPRTASVGPRVPPKGRGASSGHEIVFNGRVPGNNGPGGLLRMHYRTKKALLAAYGMEVYLQVARVQFVGPVRLELIRYSTGRPMDYDNLVSTGKLLLDAVVRAGVLPDDSPAVIAERHYSQQRATGKDTQRTVLRLMPLAAAAPGETH